MISTQSSILIRGAVLTQRLETPLRTGIHAALGSQISPIGKYFFFLLALEKGKVEEQQCSEMNHLQ